MTGSRVYGPLISTAKVADHQRLLGDVFGMVVRGSVAISAQQSAGLLGTDVPAELVALQTPGVVAGAVLCRFEATDGVAAETVRDPDARIQFDAFRVVDFYVPDFEKALAHAADAGFPMHTDEASYETHEGGFREAHPLGADHVVTAFLHGDAGFFTGFAEVRDRVTSEPISISLPLTDAAATVEWYRDVFGWGIVYEYDFVDASFSALMGVDDELRVRSVTIGPSRQQTYVNVVDYGLPAGAGDSLAGRSVAPRRGLLGLVVLTDDLDDVLKGAGGAPVVGLEFPPYGPTRAAMVSAPFGSPHLVVERISCGPGTDPSGHRR